jgi:UDP-4-amino-4,6-dideoxy-N-acetyl-beta-L-altrosamine transaminase
MADTKAAAFLPYGRQVIEDDDIAAVAQALRADLLTTGPRVTAFEEAFAAKVGARHAVACSNGTAALHLAMMALGLRRGQVTIVPSLTFLATANCARFEDAEVQFADVAPNTGLMTPATLEMAISRVNEQGAGAARLRAVLPVHYGGNPADLPRIRALAEAAGAVVVEDACHGLGTAMDFGTGREQIGDCTHSAMSTFSFHPVKTIACGEGGMVTTNDPVLAERLMRLRSHGMVRQPNAFSLMAMAFDETKEGERDANPWFYEMPQIGYNYRLPDVLCALGISQLAKLDRFAARRRTLSVLYRQHMAELAPVVSLVASPQGADPALHLMVALIDFKAVGLSRKQVMDGLAARGIGSQVHYIPVHRQPYYQDRYGLIDLPGADAFYSRCLSLPLFAGMEDSDPERVVLALRAVLGL